MSLLFVYGTLKRGYGNNQRLRNSRFIGEATTCDKLRFFNLGSFPGLTLEHGPSTVSGELYEVTPEDLAACDYLEGIPNFYNRVEIEIEVGGDDGMRQKTFTYIIIAQAHRKFWIEITNGEWKT